MAAENTGYTGGGQPYPLPPMGDGAQTHVTHGTAPGPNWPDPLITNAGGMFPDALSSASSTLDTRDGRLAAQEAAQCAEGRVRFATPEDVDALVAVELRAFSDVYGEEPEPDVTEDVQRKYVERVDLLASSGLILVIEDDEGVYGMVVCCRTDLGEGSFIPDAHGRFVDMTDNDDLRWAHDPNGSNGYIVNFAVTRGHTTDSGRLLLQAAMERGAALGVEQVYFESRLPGLARWAEKQRAAAAKAGNPIPRTDETDRELANAYWRLKRNEGDPESLPRDPLLAYYVARTGAVPVALVADAWKPDRSSHGYGVLCKVDLPQGQPNEEPTEGPQQPSALDGQITSPDDLFHVLGERSTNWAREHPLEVAALGALVVSLAALGANGQLGHAIDQFGNDPAFAPWRALTVVYVATLALQATGIAINGAEWLSRKIPPLRDALPPERWEHIRHGTEQAVKWIAWVNFVAAVGASVAAGAGVMAAIPEGVGRSSLFAFLGADLLQTISSRFLFLKFWGRHSSKTEKQQAPLESGEGELRRVPPAIPDTL